jgi:hypothetical protein
MTPDSYSILLKAWACALGAPHASTDLQAAWKAALAEPAPAVPIIPRAAPEPVPAAPAVPVVVVPSLPPVEWDAVFARDQFGTVLEVMVTSGDPTRTAWRIEPIRDDFGHVVAAKIQPTGASNE